jgi:acetyl-CoA C-acetyltransferase
MTSRSRAVHIVAFARTPFGRFRGALKDIPAPQLAALVIDAVHERAAIAPAAVDAVIAGVGMIGAAVLTPARQALLLTQLPPATPSLAVDRACCSGMTAIGLGFKDIEGGYAEIVICGGFDNLSRTPILLERGGGERPGRVGIEDPLRLRHPRSGMAIAAYTGHEALRLGIDRTRQDEWALESHQRYFEAEARGDFAEERLLLPALATDESPRRDTSLERLARLPAIYDSPTVTAGNAPGLNDGAAFLALASAAAVERLALRSLGRIVGFAQVAGPDTSGSWTPAVAIEALLRRENLAVNDLDALEINEAYAATPLASTLHLAGGDADFAEVLRRRTNEKGGAVALGHPLGASGARIVMSLLQTLRRRGGGIGAAAICGGFGQGDGLMLAAG